MIDLIDKHLSELIGAALFVLFIASAYELFIKKQDRWINSIVVAMTLLGCFIVIRNII